MHFDELFLQLLMMALDLHGTPTADQICNLLKDPMLFPVLSRSYHGHMYPQKGNIDVLFLFSPRVFSRRFCFFVALFASLGLTPTI